MDNRVAKFVENYNKLSKHELDRLNDMYHWNVRFQDPIHDIEGLDALRGYFSSLYQNLVHINFVVEHYFELEEFVFLYWTMNFRHQKLNGCKDILVSGHSHLVFKGEKVSYHRDYLDLGEMLYEHIPALGWAVKAIKKKASQ